MQIKVEALGHIKHC